MFSDTSWFPVCSGVLFTLGLAGLVILAGWSWLWPGRSRNQLYKPLKLFLAGGPDELVSRAIQIMLAEVKDWEEDRIAPSSIQIFVETGNKALDRLPGGKEQAIDEYMSALAILLTGLPGLLWLACYFDIVGALFIKGIPGALGVLRVSAEGARLEPILEFLEPYEDDETVDGESGRRSIMQGLQDRLGRIGDETSLTRTQFVPWSPSYPRVAIGDFSRLTGGFRDFFNSPMVVLRGCSPVVLFLVVSGVVGVCGLLYWIWDGGPWSGYPELDVDLVEIPSAPLASPTLAPTFTPAPTPTPNPIDVILRSPWLNEEQKAQIFAAYLFDPEGDWIYSIASDHIVNSLLQTDILGFGSARLRLSQSRADTLFNNSEYPCGEQIEDGFVVCTSGAGPIPAGDLLMIVVKLADAIPEADRDHFYTFAAVFDADGNPANNFKFQFPYDWDYFQGTDRWYQLNWNPDQQTWTLSVSDVVLQQFNALSAARAVVLGDTLVFFIPADELPAEMLGFRVSAFGHDGTYALEASSGDVSGANPTEPLTIISEEVIPIE